MTRNETQQFKDLFHQYCRQEIAANHCVADGCDLCTVNQAYAEIFDNLSDEECSGDDE